MRTLKKTLCLVLCLAMMVGLCAVAASAVSIDDYKDKEVIQYKEAVELLSALNVLEGYPDGTFKPATELNRAEGAAIMTRLLTKATPAGKSSFTDMAGYEWAQPYVKFCEDYGIIAGYGDGKFGPGDKLTTSQFAKMLICALGYEAETEGFVGTPMWEINVTKKVTGLNLADGLKAYAPAANVSRETAAQLSYNTLRKAMVYADGNSYLISLVGGEGSGIASITLKNGAPVPNTSYSYNGVDDGVMQFIEAAFPDIKVKEDDDAFAIPTNYWFKGKNPQDSVYKEEKLLCETIAVPVLARYAEGIDEVTGKEVYNDAGFAGGNGYIEVFENGEEVDDLFVTSKQKDLLVFSNKEENPYGGAEAFLLDMGTDRNGEPIVRLAVKYPYLAKVVAVLPGDDRTVTLSVYNDPEGTSTAIATMETAQFEKGEYILVYPDGAIAKTASPATDLEILKAEAAASKEGKLTKVKLTKNDVTGLATHLTVGGEQLPVGSLNLANLGPVENEPVRTYRDNYSINHALTAYSSFGYVLGVVPDSVTYSNWFFAYGPGHKVENPFGGTSWTYGYVKQDATAVETKINTADNVYKEDIDAMFWTYGLNAAEPYTRWASKAQVGGKTVTAELDMGLRHDQPDLDSAYTITTDSKTVFVLRTAAGFQAVTGIHNLPSDYTKDEGIYTTKAYGLVPADGAHAVAVYIDLRGLKPDSGPATAPDPIYLLGIYPNTKQDDEGKTVYAYDAIVDGKKGEILALAPFDTDVVSIAGLYQPYYDGKYVDELLPLDEADPRFIVLNTDAEVIRTENDTIQFNDAKSTTWAVSKDVKIFVYDLAKEKLFGGVSLDSLTGLPTGEGYSITAVATAKDKTIVTIYYFYDSDLI